MALKVSLNWKIMQIFVFSFPCAGNLIRGAALLLQKLGVDFVGDTFEEAFQHPSICAISETSTLPLVCRLGMRKPEFASLLSRTCSGLQGMGFIRFIVWSGWCWKMWSIVSRTRHRLLCGTLWRIWILGGWTLRETATWWKTYCKWTAQDQTRQLMDQWLNQRSHQPKLYLDDLYFLALECPCCLASYLNL